MNKHYLRQASFEQLSDAYDAYCDQLRHYQKRAMEIGAHVGDILTEIHTRQLAQQVQINPQDEPFVVGACCPIYPLQQAEWNEGIKRTGGNG